MIALLVFIFAALERRVFERNKRLDYKEFYFRSNVFKNPARY